MAGRTPPEALGCPLLSCPSLLLASHPAFIGGAITPALRAASSALSALAAHRLLSGFTWHSVGQVSPSSCFQPQGRGFPPSHPAGHPLCSSWGAPPTVPLWLLGYRAPGPLGVSAPHTSPLPRPLRVSAPPWVPHRSPWLAHGYMPIPGNVPKILVS